jgi:flagellar biogenesis protein FliO
VALKLDGLSGSGTATGQGSDAEAEDCSSCRQVDCDVLFTMLMTLIVLLLLVIVVVYWLKGIL